MHDLVIRAGTVVDGTGQAPFTADIGISNGTITDIGKGIGAARQELDADGLLATLVAGQVVLADDELTGVRPGRLVRS